MGRLRSSHETETSKKTPVEGDDILPMTMFCYPWLVFHLPCRRTKHPGSPG